MSITKALLTHAGSEAQMQGKHVPLHKAHCKHEISDLGRWPAFKCRYWFQQFGFGQFSWTSWWVFKNTSVSSSLPKSTSYSLIPPGWGGRNDSLQSRELSHACKSSYSSPTVAYLVKAVIRKIWWCHNAHLHIISSRHRMCMAFEEVSQSVTSAFRNAVRAAWIRYVRYFPRGHHPRPNG